MSKILSINELECLASAVEKIALKAGECILEIYHNVENFEISHKNDDSPLTIADKNSNKIICESLLSLNPVLPIISEENDDVPFEIRKNYEYFWLVDPLDGTKEFISRNGEFTVNISLIHKNKPVLGVIYVPCHNELFYAVKGAGAFKAKDGQKTGIYASHFSLKNEGVRVVASRSHQDPETKKIIESLNKPQITSKGSSLKFLILAEGKADYYPRMSPTMEWDTAAAQIILEEAGGKVLQVSGEEVIYNKECLLNPYFVAQGKLSKKERQV
jgi:3'(2'), 5'-bisphosphate nucleotidase